MIFSEYFFSVKSQFAHLKRIKKSCEFGSDAIFLFKADDILLLSARLLSITVQLTVFAENNKCAVSFLSEVAFFKKNPAFSIVCIRRNAIKCKFFPAVFSLT